MFTEIDDWIGKTLFVPLIIRLCQLTRQSQFAMSKLLWFIAALDGFYRAETLFDSFLWGGLSVLMLVTAAHRADRPSASFMFIRLLAFVLLVFDLAEAAWTGEWGGAEFWFLVLMAEYAATIRTLPPRTSPKSSKSVPPADLSRWEP